MNRVNRGLNTHDKFAHECKIRDAYRDNLPSLRPDDYFLKTEVRYQSSTRRADMRTVTKGNILKEWEFKKFADVTTLGQILNYVRIAKEEFPERTVVGVIAAFDFSADVCKTNRGMCLGLELVTIPAWLENGGLIPISYKKNKFQMPKIKIEVAL